jgi:hypothetical protein
MTSKIDNGGPAFPYVWKNRGDRNATAPTGDIIPAGCEVTCGGMTLRDYFAAQIMPAIIREYAAKPGAGWEDCMEASAILAYLIADAMLAERKKSNG